MMNAEGISGAEAAQLVRDNELMNKKIESDNKSGKQDAVEQAVLLSKVYVNKNANPHPMYIVLIVVCCLLLLYVIYLLFVKPNATGQWVVYSGKKPEDLSVAEYDDLVIIEHNTLTDNFTQQKYNVDADVKTDLMNGQFRDNLYVIGNYTGVWDYKDNIFFTTGGGMIRVRDNGNYKITFKAAK